MKGIPQFVVHGDADNTVNVSGSRNMVAALKKLNAERHLRRSPRRQPHRRRRPESARGPLISWHAAEEERCAPARNNDNPIDRSTS